MDADQTLTSIISSTPESIDERLDQLKLLGLVVGWVALLEVATRPILEKGDAAAKVAAARALTNLKETPESIAERLRRSPFAGLNTGQLERIVQYVKDGGTDIPAFIQSLKGVTNGRDEPAQTSAG